MLSAKVYKAILMDILAYLQSGMKTKPVSHCNRAIPYCLHHGYQLHQPLLLQRLSEVHGKHFK